MCSIFGSFNKNTITELLNINQYRGNFSYSISIIDTTDCSIYSQYKDFGEFDIRQIPDGLKEKYYILCHVQAPTGGLITTLNRVHPSIYSYATTCEDNIIYKNDSYLWHNGILKDDFIQKIRPTLKISQVETWDTYILHNYIKNTKCGWDCLSHVDGSFGCIYLDVDKIFSFTSDTINLYIDDNFNISSVKPNNSYKRQEPNNVFMWDFKNKKKEIVGTFNSLSSPYFIIEE